MAWKALRNEFVGPGWVSWKSLHYKWIRLNKAKSVTVVILDDEDTGVCA